MFIELQGQFGPVFIRASDVKRIVAREDGTTIRLDEGCTEFVKDDARAVLALVAGAVAK